MKTMRVFDVYDGKGYQIDSIFYTDSRVTCEDVRKSLIDHDGYDTAIVVKERV